MTGQLTLRAPHLDGTEPIAVWFAAAWALYADFAVTHGRDGVEALDSLMDSLCEPGEDDPDGVAAAGPTMETWGADEEAQAAQAEFMRTMQAGGFGGPAG